MRRNGQESQFLERSEAQRLNLNFTGPRRNEKDKSKVVYRLQVLQELNEWDTVFAVSHVLTTRDEYVCWNGSSLSLMKCNWTITVILVGFLTRVFSWYKGFLIHTFGSLLSHWHEDYVQATTFNLVLPVDCGHLQTRVISSRMGLFATFAKSQFAATSELDWIDEMLFLSHCGLWCRPDSDPFWEFLLTLWKRIVWHPHEQLISMMRCHLFWIWCLVASRLFLVRKDSMCIQFTSLSACRIDGTESQCQATQPSVNCKLLVLDSSCLVLFCVLAVYLQIWSCMYTS